MARDIPIDEVGEEVRNQIWTTFSPAPPAGLGLTLAQQGSQASMPGPDDMDNRLPGVWLEFLSWNGEPNRGLKCSKGSFRFRAHYFVRLVAGDEPGRKAVQGAQRIAKHFNQGSWTFPGGTSAAMKALGVLIERCYAGAVALVPDAQLVLYEFLIDHATVDITVDADLFDHA